ncbi:MAG TPA: hypothetical protein VNC42_09300, partial [Bradyrhizobium sp.]|nr:hypothetical protein [Bradyrhizobium sp.]
AFHSAHARSDSMRLDSELPRRLPYAKFSEVRHTASFTADDLALPSFAPTHQPSAASASSTENGKRKTENGKRATGNGKRVTGNGQRATGNANPSPKASTRPGCV